MDTTNVKKFLSASDSIVNQANNAAWDIPNGTDKQSGELGLLPEDTKIEAWQIPTSSAMFLRFMVLAQRSQTILELGASIGFSTIWLALGAKETGGHVYTTEIFPEKAQVAKDNSIAAGMQEQITLLEQDILEVIQKWDKKKKIDFVFMDADKQRYHLYLENMYPLLNDGAMVVVDNVGNYRQYMPLFLKQCTKLEDAAVHYLAIDNGLLLLVKNGGTNIAEEIDIFNPNGDQHVRRV